MFSQAGVDLRQRVHELCHQQVHLGRMRITYQHWSILQSSLLGCWVGVLKMTRQKCQKTNWDLVLNYGFVGVKSPKI